MRGHLSFLVMGLQRRSALPLTSWLSISSGFSSRLEPWKVEQFQLLGMGKSPGLNHLGSVHRMFIHDHEHFPLGLLSAAAGSPETP